MATTGEGEIASAVRVRWRPDRLPSEVRQMAEEAARQAAVPLAVWLARLVREISAVEWVASASAPRHPAPASPEQPLPSAAHTVLTMLAENLKHADFPPLDEARAYLRLVREFALTPDRIGAAVGRPPEHVAKAIRLLALPKNVRRLIERRSLSAGHAYALIETRDPAALASLIVGQGLSIEEARRRLESA
jgi:ParB family chromosome partitioning protein